jgi:hypothetical protein
MVLIKDYLVFVKHFDKDKKKMIPANKFFKITWRQKKYAAGKQLKNSHENVSAPANKIIAHYPFFAWGRSFPLNFFEFYGQKIKNIRIFVPFS